METKDLYILDLDRIVNRRSKNVVLFQHGVCDSSYVWVANGLNDSFSFRVSEHGFDVWIGNFRGNGERLGGAENYFGYSVDELGKYDTLAFINKIIEVKKDEGIDCVDITLVGHSMGGMASVIYVLT